ncbi:SdrD B-like domain-containing protein [Acidibrevibacterium fodinaquatile]|uniref:SdrD B-like domain-containing protein n=1 Tax=Acidibrevibacterium fodinaquatile TaxID=1969806 RepID=UPI000E0DEAE6|nr:SdrD B-like domain-containing protein [Acidibrevibacterium fodinaquatile]
MSSSQTFPNVSGFNLAFTNIAVSETDSGSVTPFIGQTSSAILLPVAGGEIEWAGFHTGAIAPGGSETLDFSYDVTSTNAADAITNLGLSMVPDSAVAAGESLTAIETVYNPTTNAELGQITVNLTNPTAPPYIAGDIPLTSGETSLKVDVQVIASVSSSAASTAQATFSQISQSFGQTPLTSLGSIGDNVFLSPNASGIQSGVNAGPGVAGVTVELENTSGTVLETTTTNSQGLYDFTNLTAGTYEVQFVAPTGYDLTPQTSIANDLGSAPNQTTGITQAITLAPGQNITNIDAGLYQPASIGDNVFLDTAGTGIQSGVNAGPGVAGVTVDLENTSGTVLETTTTNSQGLYDFTNLTPGTYEVQFVTPSGYTLSPQTSIANDLGSAPNQTTGITAPITLTSGENVTNIDAGLVPLGSIGDNVFLSPNASGIQSGVNAGPGVAGVTVELENTSGTVLETTTTNSQGLYDFTNLTAGTYEVQFVAPTGYDFTPQTSIANDLGSAPNQTTGITQAITLAPGQNITNIDAGLYQPASIGDNVFLDTAGTGIQSGVNAGPGVAGVTVELENTSGTVLETTTTNSQGLYDFTNLTPGTYEVQFVTPSGYTLSPQTSIANDLGSAPNQTTGITAPITLTSGENVTNIDAGLVPSSSTGTTTPSGPSISVIKVPSSVVINNCGQVTYTIDVTNTGNTNLYNPQVTDNIGTASQPDDITAKQILSGGYNIGDTNHNGVFNPGETWQYTVTVSYQTSGTGQGGSGGNYQQSGYGNQGGQSGGQGANCDTNQQGGYGSQGGSGDNYQQNGWSSGWSNSGDTQQSGWSSGGQGGQSGGQGANCDTNQQGGYGNQGGQGGNYQQSGWSSGWSNSGDTQQSGWSSGGQGGQSGGQGASCDTNQQGGYGSQGGSGDNNQQSGWSSGWSNSGDTQQSGWSSGGQGGQSGGQGANCDTNQQGGYGSQGGSGDNDQQNGWSSGWSNSGDTQQSGWSSGGQGGQSGGQGANCDTNQQGGYGNQGGSGDNNQQSGWSSGWSNSGDTQQSGWSSGGQGGQSGGQGANCDTNQQGGYGSQGGSGDNYQQNGWSSGWSNSGDTQQSGWSSGGQGGQSGGQGANCDTNQQGGYGNQGGSGDNNQQGGQSGGQGQNCDQTSPGCEQQPSNGNTGYADTVTVTASTCPPSSTGPSGCDNQQGSSGGSQQSGQGQNCDTNQQSGYGNQGGSGDNYQQSGWSSGWSNSGDTQQSGGTSGGQGSQSGGQSQNCDTNQQSGWSSGGSNSGDTQQSGWSSGGQGGQSGGQGQNCDTNQQSGWSSGWSNSGDTQQSGWSSGGQGGQSGGQGQNCDTNQQSGDGNQGGSGDNNNQNPGTTPCVTVTASDTKEIQVLAANSDITVGGSAPTGNLASLYGTAQTLEFTYNPGDTVSLASGSTALASVSGANSQSLAFLEISNNANPFASGSQIYFEGSVTTGENIYADAALNPLTNIANTGASSHFSTTPGAETYAFIFGSQADFAAGDAPIQTMAYDTSGAHSMNLGDTIGSLKLVGYIGDQGGHLVA